MSPAQSFRLWLRRSPRGERAAATAVVAVVLALTAWLIVPQVTPSAAPAASQGTSQSAASVGAAGTAAQPGTAPGGQPPGAGGQVATGANGVVTANGGTSPGTTVGAAQAGSQLGNQAGAQGGTNPAAGCVAPPGSAQGVSATTIKVAVVLTDIAGPASDQAFGGDPPDTLKSDYEAVIDSINKSGGVACRKLLPKFYTANPADQSNLQQTCLDIVQSGVFAVLDQGAYADYPPVKCFAQHHLPYFGSYIQAQSVLGGGYPYLFEFESYESVYRNAVFALRDRGFFSPAHGFKKLGFVYRNCYPQMIDQMKGWLHQAGVSDAQLVTYTVGCPSGFANPSDVEQAVLTFQRAGVTNVTIAQFVGDFPNFTTFAQRQNFHPQYGFGDDSVISTTYGSLHPDFDNIAGAIAIVGHRIGEERTAGMRPTPATARCNAIYAAHGKPPVYQRKLGGGGRICNNVAYFAAAVDHAPALAQNALAAGLQRAQSVDFSFPDGPNVFGNGVTHGGEFWRVDQFVRSCTCWRVVDRTFHQSY